MASLDFYKVWVLADQKQLGLISQYSLELRQLTAILLLMK